VAPNEAQRRQLKETLAQYGDSIQTKYGEALSLALEPDLAPKNEKLNQAIREFDLTTRAWDSRNVELGNALEEAQSELEQARSDFNDVGQKYAELSRQITLLSQLEQFEEEVAAGTEVTREAWAKLAAQLPDDLKERLSSSGSASEVHEEVSRERDLLDYHRSDGIYTLLKGELDTLNTGADLLDQMPEQQQQQNRQREQELIQELQSRGLPLALQVQERELKLETAREELQAHQTQKPLLREEVTQLKTEIEALRSAFERNRAAFSAQLQRVRDILDEN
jgi:chromosome segregation ATPase